jgi:hypothetical protein
VVFTLAVMVSRHLHPVPPPGSAGAAVGRAGFSSAFTIRVELEGSSPLVWRRFRCPSDVRLDEVHRVVQAVMGWTNSHLHDFTPSQVLCRAPVVVFDPEDIYADPDEGAVPESDVRLDRVLQTVGETLGYLYDFGDSWEHTLTLEAITRRDPEDRQVRCVAGERAAPPENIGGIGFYEDLLAALHGPAQWRDLDVMETLEMSGLIGRDDTFDLEETNAALVRDAGARAAWEEFEKFEGQNRARVVLAEIWAQLSAGARLHTAGFMAGADLDTVPDPTPDVAEHATRVIRGLLNTVGTDGVTLTGAGYLPPVVVTALMGVLDPEQRWFGERNREVNIAPLQALREASTALGLTRHSKGRLVLTKVGAALREDPAGLWDHIARRLPLERQAGVRDIGVFGLLVTAAGVVPGSRRFGEELALLVGMAGWVPESPYRGDDRYLFHKARLTRHILEWADTGVLTERYGAAPPESPTVSELLARTAWGS